MSVAVPPEALRAELESRANVGYLLTVGESGRPHCVAVTIAWDGDELLVASGSTSRRNAAARPAVTLLCPPSGRAREGDEPKDGASAVQEYSLIVDGEAVGSAEVAGNPSTVRMRPVHAVLHRPAVGPGGGRLHDCSPVFDAPATGP